MSLKCPPFGRGCGQQVEAAFGAGKGNGNSYNLLGLLETCVCTVNFSKTARTFTDPCTRKPSLSQCSYVAM